jgi:hypothetical protein
METVMAFVAEWWRVGLAVGGGAVVWFVLWRVALADLVLSSVELPSCERAERSPHERAERSRQSMTQPNGNVPG